MLFITVAMLAAIAMINGQEDGGRAVAACVDPSLVSTETYTTKSTLISAKTVYIAQFSVACKSGGNMDLFAEVNGEIIPAAKQIEADTYQVSWSADHKTATTGSFHIKVYSEEGYLAYKKAARNGEDVNDVPYIVGVTLAHSGTQREGLFVQTEFLAVIGLLLVWWMANSVRSQIME